MTNILIKQAQMTKQNYNGREADLYFDEDNLPREGWQYWVDYDREHNHMMFTITTETEDEFLRGEVGRDGCLEIRNSDIHFCHPEAELENMMEIFKQLIKLNLRLKEEL